MEWARYSPDPWAPDSRHPNLWATDSRGRLTLGRAVELLLGAKAAEGASPRRTELVPAWLIATWLFVRRDAN
jgi:hypothetical protein